MQPERKESKAMSANLMAVAMVQIGKMRMAMTHRDMAMAMRMRFGAFVAAVRVLVVRVVNVAMLVLHGLMLVLMSVPLGEDEPGAAGGQGEGCGERASQRLA
jgi:hypothetical protein